MKKKIQLRLSKRQRRIFYGWRFERWHAESCRGLNFGSAIAPSLSALGVALNLSPHLCAEKVSAPGILISSVLSWWHWVNTENIADFWKDNYAIFFQLNDGTAMQEAMQQFKKDYAASTPSAYVSYKEFKNAWTWLIPSWTYNNLIRCDSRFSILSNPFFVFELTNKKM